MQWLRLFVGWLDPAHHLEDGQVKSFIINRALETCQTERGIETNEHCPLWIVQKMGN